SGSEDGTVRLWNVAAEHFFQSTRERGEGVRSVTFSPDGKLLAYASPGDGVHLWDVVTGGEAPGFPGQAPPVYAIAFSPDGKLLASGSKDNKVIVWDLSGRRQLRALEGHTDLVSSL